MAGPERGTARRLGDKSGAPDKFARRSPQRLLTNCYGTQWCLRSCALRWEVKSLRTNVE